MGYMDHRRGWRVWDSMRKIILSRVNVYFDETKRGVFECVEPVNTWGVTVQWGPSIEVCRSTAQASSQLNDLPAPDTHQESDISEFGASESADDSKVRNSQDQQERDANVHAQTLVQQQRTTRASSQEPRVNPQAPQQAQRQSSASIADTSVPVRNSSSRRAPTERTITVSNKTWQRQNGRIERTMAAMPVHEEFIIGIRCSRAQKL